MEDWAALYKFARLGSGTRADKIRAVVVYRVAAIIAVSLILPGLVAAQETAADHPTFVLRETATGKVVHEFPASRPDYSRRYSCSAFSPDGKRIADDKALEPPLATQHVGQNVLVARRRHAVHARQELPGRQAIACLLQLGRGVDVALEKVVAFNPRPRRHRSAATEANP